MTLLTAIIIGSACGYQFGFGRRAFAAFLAIWAAVIVIQTFVVLSRSDTDDPSYWPVQVVILGVAALMIWLGSTVRARRAHAA